MGHLSVRQWAIAALSAVAILVLALGAFAWNFAQEAIRAAEFVNHTQQVIAEVARMQSNLEQAEASQRGYMISRRPDFIAERDEALNRFDAGLRNVTRQTLDNPRSRTAWWSCAG